MKVLPHAPVTAAEIRPDWIAEVRALLRREGRAVRPSPALAPVRIEVKSLRTDQWEFLGLPAGGNTFATEADRDAVLAQIVEP